MWMLLKGPNGHWVTPGQRSNTVFKSARVSSDFYTVWHKNKITSPKRRECPCTGSYSTIKKKNAHFISEKDIFEGRKSCCCWRGIHRNSSRPPPPCPQQCPSPLYSPEARPRTNRVDKMIDLAKNLTWRFLLATGVLLSSLHSFNNMSGFYSLGHQQLKPMHSLVGVEVRMGLCSKGILFNFLSKNGTFQLIDGK